MITLTQNEEKIITKIRQLSSDEIQKLEEFIDQLSQSSDSTEKPHPWLEFAGIFRAC
jgi:transcription initiation factor IIF auxiliary subunit